MGTASSIPKMKFRCFDPQNPQKWIFRRVEVFSGIAFSHKKDLRRRTTEPRENRLSKFKLRCSSGRNFAKIFYLATTKLSQIFQIFYHFLVLQSKNFHFFTEGYPKSILIPNHEKSAETLFLARSARQEYAHSRAHESEGFLFLYQKQTFAT